MSMTGPLARAARALVQWPRAHAASAAGLQEDAVADFEAGRAGLDFADIARLRDALERGGAVFIDDDSSGGSGCGLSSMPRMCAPSIEWRVKVGRWAPTTSEAEHSSLPGKRP